MPKKILDAPSAPPPVGPYSVVTEANGFVFISGQGAMNLVDESVEAQAELVMKNIGAILGDIGLTDMGDFPEVNAIYGAYVADAKPARSTVEVSGLPLGIKVEIEVIAAR